MGEAFIKIHRKMLEWEWYKDTNTFCLFLHCLLIANWKDGKFMGCDIPRGSFVSSYSQLAQQTNMSVQNVRTAINHLKSTGELTVNSHAKFSIFTVVNYNRYQDDNRQANKQVTDNQQATNKQLTTIEEYKEKKEDKEVKKYIKAKPVRHKYGQYENVLLSDEDMEKLKREFPNDYKERIERVSEYCKSKGKTYSDYLATIRSWARKEGVKSGRATENIDEEEERRYEEAIRRIQSGEDDDGSVWD